MSESTTSNTSTSGASKEQGMFAASFGLSSLLQLGAGLTASKIAKQQGKLETRQIRLNALSREADRKDALAKAMASANARSGTKGIAAFEGSPLAILNNMERQEADTSQRDQYMTDLAATTAKYKGKQSALGYQSQASTALMNSGVAVLGAL